VAGGTSGHLLGGVLAAIMLGPWPAMLVMTAVIALQGLLFQDGGLLVMGANILNMGILTAAIGYGLYRPLIGRRGWLRLAVVGVAAWLSVMAGALSTSLEIWLSGNARLEIILPAMLGVHALIGLGEAAITVAALAFILRARPDLVESSGETRRGGWGWVVAGLLLTLVVVVLSPLASADPDGLERVASDIGFIQAGQEAPYQVLPDYSLPFLGATPLSTILAGAVGVAVLVGLFFLSARLLKKKR
jgi:cobalt/nickel transport system permease protein